MKIKSNLVLVYIVFILFLAFFYVYKSKENLNNLNQSQNQNIKEPSKPDKKGVETITEKECKEHVYFLAFGHNFAKLYVKIIPRAVA